MSEQFSGQVTIVDGQGRQVFKFDSQAAVLDLYDPDRTRTPLKGGASSDWSAFWAEAGGAKAGAVTSPGTPRGRCA